MVYIKLKNDNTVIGDKYCCDGFTEEIDKKYEEDIKNKINEGYNIFIYKDNEWIEGKKYYNDEKKDDKDINIPYEEIFNKHWRKRTQAIKDFTDNIKKVKKILNYAKKNEQPDSVIEEIKEYIKELQE